MQKANHSDDTTTRRRFLASAVAAGAGSTVLALATVGPAPVAAASASPLDASKASPALRAAAQALEEAHERLKAAKARFAADDLKVAEWSINNPEPLRELSKRGHKKWVRRWREYRDSTEGESWQAQSEAEDNFRDAQVAVAKIKPRDMDELTLKACLSGVYDPVHLARGSNAVIGYSVAVNLFSLRTAAA
jgi:hypothetical protein